jgi:hypothetical protein
MKDVNRALKITLFPFLERKSYQQFADSKKNIYFCTPKLRDGIIITQNTQSNEKDIPTFC